MIHSDFIHNQELYFTCNGDTQKGIVSKIFANEDFGYSKIVVERPLRLNFMASSERIARLDSSKAFASLAESKKKDPIERQSEIEAGQERQAQIKSLLSSLPGDQLYQNRERIHLGGGRLRRAFV